MGKVIGFLERAGRSLQRGLGATGGVTDWWMMWYRSQTGNPWAHLGWFALADVYKPAMGDYNCNYLRLVRPGDVGRSDLTHWCGQNGKYEELLPGRTNPPLGAAKYWWVYGDGISGTGQLTWQFDGWLWANPAVVASLRSLPPRYSGARLYIGG